MSPIKVICVDDSVSMRNFLKVALEQDKKIQVVDLAADPYEAREKIRRHNPDVITLDVRMPKMDGLTFLEKLMQLRPMPVVMVSSQTVKGAEDTFKALEKGACDYLAKPFDPQVFDAFVDQLIYKVKAASLVNLSALNKKQDNKSIIQKRHAVSHLSKLKVQKQIKLIAIGASTGGTEATKEIVMSSSLHGPPIVVTQHMPPVFSSSYAKRLDKLLPVPVQEVTGTTKLEPGHIYIAPGDKHLLVKRNRLSLQAVLDDSLPVNRHKPSVDSLFFSVAESVGANALGILLTGMGGDGAKGLLAIRQMGGMTIVQDKATSVVWGMPGAAVSMDAAIMTLGLDDIAKEVASLYQPSLAINQ
ncbi:protein-glutamate methylesterase/protein-glutamine glutaminase [Spartinivicinus poritis]|uniref:Protein-glutamate methylesterase/protein-glutamine glutaminase n=1 Tax=Spartinivicinus poritis TaxID=2994640 RepID=A0ABT5U9U0_9GAMM|nr:chemotaxis response regulator protein-glutamate methylesterase [Spartinivicinus sp. A2-2]MDE1462930.1 chemotaxis response regulator protein-glutamate methylesterase [Spartinivicinus sp. A2-2]